MAEPAPAPDFITYLTAMPRTHPDLHTMLRRVLRELHRCTAAKSYDHFHQSAIAELLKPNPHAVRSDEARAAEANALSAVELPDAFAGYRAQYMGALADMARALRAISYTNLVYCNAYYMGIYLPHKRAICPQFVIFGTLIKATEYSNNLASILHYDRRYEGSVYKSSRYPDAFTTVPTRHGFAFRNLSTCHNIIGDHGTEINFAIADGIARPVSYWEISPGRTEQHYSLAHDELAHDKLVITITDTLEVAMHSTAVIWSGTVVRDDIVSRGEVIGSMRYCGDVLTITHTNLGAISKYCITNREAKKIE